MKPELFNLKEEKFYVFARFVISSNKLILIDAEKNDFWIMYNKDIAKVMYKN